MLIKLKYNQNLCLVIKLGSNSIMLQKLGLVQYLKS